MKNKKEIYEKALEIAVLDIEFHDGLCNYLTGATLQINHNTSYREAQLNDVVLFEEVWRQVSRAVWGIYGEFPEIAKHRSKILNRICDSYWFRRDEEGHQKRIDILKEAIASLEDDYKPCTDVDEC